MTQLLPILIGSALILPGTAAAAGPACTAARAYARLVQEQRYDRVGSLFAENGSWYAPNGTVARGPQAISRAYQAFLAPRRPIFRTDGYVDGGRRCVMEVSMKVRVDSAGKVVLGPDGAAAIVPDGSSQPGVFVRRAIDHFTVDAHGRVTRMIVYNAPTTYWRP